MRVSPKFHDETLGAGAAATGQWIYDLHLTLFLLSQARKRGFLPKATGRSQFITTYTPSKRICERAIDDRSP